MSTTQDRTRLAERVNEARGYWAQVEAMDPARARRDRKWQTERGVTSEFDDPNVTVRASVLEALLEDQS